ncbi:MAG: DUF4870 domain-containing protein [Dehalococcoidales bacterium]|jgi:uncharacterized membrane protein|nr:DUF4870 domain-containing protein [Dehalococcoidales bacterium]MDD4465226.1 DUF4870 domain-containing protein [Dehalococcoidales bacterium]MDD5401884.1 DUF4870 domain-containing protein [Dehalococcoidales bacterium]
MAKTSSGLEENVAGLLCYAFGWISGLIFLLIEKDNAFIRFHAWQSIVVFGAFSIAMIILGVIPLVKFILMPILGLVIFILWIILMIKAYQGNHYKLPWAGDLAEKWASTVNI